MKTTMDAVLGDQETRKQKTQGVETLLGNPRKAIIKLAIPATISSLFMAIYQVTDIIWVSGLGADALAVMGFIGPFFMVSMAVASCCVVGGGISISRKIGEGDKKGVDSLGEHTFILSLLFSLILFVIMVAVAKPILLLMGAVKVIETATKMVYITAASTFLLLFGQTAGAILYNEGDAKRAMIVSLTFVLLNMILDPIFIYLLRMGIVGSAVASVVSMMVTCLILIYWFFIKKNTYVSCRYKGFTFNKERVFAIVKLGLPVTMAQLIAPLSGFFIISIISKVSGTDGVAVHSTGMRFTNLILQPTLSVAYAITTVVAAARGARDFEKLKIAFYYALKIGLAITCLLSILTYIIAPQITIIFTWSKESAGLTQDLETFLRMFAWFYVSMTLWTTSVCFFVGIGHSIFDFLFNFLKNALFVIPLAYVFGSILGYGLTGIWTIIIVGMWLQGVSAFVLVGLFLKDFEKGKF